MSINTNKNILITSGLGQTSQNSVSQIDFKWSESGIGTFVFSPNSNDIRSTIYNWQESNQPVLLFGGAGTYNGVQYFVGPYVDYSDNFNGISSSPTIKFYPLAGSIYANVISITSTATFGNLNVSGVATAGYFIGDGSSLTNLNASNLSSGIVPNARLSGTYSGITSVGILSNLQVSGVTTSGYYFGIGSNLTNLNASNLALGTVPNARLSGTYSGITNLQVSGITTLGITSFTSFIYDGLISKGTPGQVLSATATGVAWTNQSSGSGTVGGSIAANQVAYGSGSNTIQGSNNLQFDGTTVSLTGNINASGIVTSSGFFGPGTNITNLNASNLSSGTVPSAVVSGTYSGITSLGTLTQLSVLGLSTFSGNIKAASISSVSNIDFNINTQGLTTLPGRMFWDVNQQELAISLLYNGEIAHLGQDQVQQIYNNTGNILGVGTVVYYNGVYSGWPTVSLADAVIFNHGVGIGVIQTPIGINSYGYVHISGPITVDTRGFSTGPLYLSVTPGILTSIQPSSPNFSVNVAYAINTQAQGQIIIWPGSPLRVNQTGSILFADALGKPGSSFTSFFIDVTGGTYNVGIGTNVAPNRLSVQGSANFAGSVSITTSLTLNAAQGTPPLIINSTTQVNNLNSQYWSGNLNPAIQVGDMFYASGVDASTISRIPPNATTGLQFLGQSGDGSTAGAPSWQTLPTTGFLNYFLVGSAATGIPGVYQLTSNSVIGLGTITTVFNSAGTVGLGSFITQSGVPNLLYLPAGNLIAYAWLTQTTNQAGRFASVKATFFETNGFGTAIGVIGTTISATITATPTLYTLTYSQPNIYNFQSLSSRIKVNFDATTTGNTNTIKLEYGDGKNSYVNISAPGADVTNFVPYFGSIKDVNLSNFGISANNFDLNISPIGFSTTPGRISWNNSAGKPQVGLVYNNETANLAGNVTLVYNNSGSALGVGSVVYISGVAGVNTAVPAVSLADNVFYSHALGVGVIQSTIGINSYGYIHTGGNVVMNTTQFNAGDTLYVSSSSGILTNISPYSPNFNVVVGVALNSSTNGSILVQPSSPSRFNSQGTLLFANSQGLPYGITTAFFIDDVSGTYGLGIGTTNVSARLDINVTNYPNSKALLLRGAVNQLANIFEVRDSNNIIYNSITGIGSVGISTAAPQSSLHVVGATRIDGSLVLNSSNIKSQRIFIGTSISTTSNSFIGISSIFVPSGYSLSVEGKANGYFSTTLNESGKFFASYYNAGSLIQVGNSDITSKFNGSYGNFDIQVGLGSFINIVVKSNSSSNLWFWGVSYDYLLTQNS